MIAKKTLVAQMAARIAIMVKVTTGWVTVRRCGSGTLANCAQGLSASGLVSGLLMSRIFPAWQNDVVVCGASAMPRLRAATSRGELPWMCISAVTRSARRLTA